MCSIILNETAVFVPLKHVKVWKFVNASLYDGFTLCDFITRTNVEMFLPEVNKPITTGLFFRQG